MGDPFFTRAAAGAFAPFETDDVTITSRDLTIAAGATHTALVTVYAGKAGLQEGNGSVYYTPNGAMEQSDALLVVSNNVPACLPNIKVNDIVTRSSDGKRFTVVSVSNRVRRLPHIELMLKVGVAAGRFQSPR